MVGLRAEARADNPHEDKEDVRSEEDEARGERDPAPQRGGGGDKVRAALVLRAGALRTARA